MNSVRITLATALACILMVNVSLAEEKKSGASDAGKRATSGDSGGKVKVYDFSNDSDAVKGKGSTGPTKPKPVGSQK